MKTNFKYQLILLGSCAAYQDELIDVFRKTVSDLEMIEDAFIVITEDNFKKEYKGNQPAFVIYFGDQNGRLENEDITEILLNDGNSILPLYFRSFYDETPGFLENQNGLAYDRTKNQSIVNLALESFGRIRNTRKVFISYKRNESTSVAIQLYEALEKHNFDVFLDTHSIKKGDEFQEELWHRMADCDVIVLLNTPGFLDSKWCKEEIAEANAKKIGLVQLVWPGHKLESTNEICTPYALEDTDFNDGVINNKDKSKLKESIIQDIIVEVESLRARTLASRQDALITEFLNAAKRQNKPMNIQPSRYITEELGHKKRRLFIPTVGVPQSINCHQTEDIKKEMVEYEIDEIHLIYDDLRIRDKWLNHLDWLNGYLKVQTIKQQEFDLWLQKS
jgi:hypothetical protein